jgi:hypothetical protein
MLLGQRLRRSEQARPTPIVSSEWVTMNKPEKNTSNDQSTREHELGVGATADEQQRRRRRPQAGSACETSATSIAPVAIMLFAAAGSVWNAACFSIRSLPARALAP